MHAASTEPSVSTKENASPRRCRTRLAALVIAPLMILAAACKPSDVVNPVIGLFGMGKNEVATPQFTIVGGIKIQVVIKAPDGKGGIPIVVHVRCAGGTNASQTVNLADNGNISLGETTFQQGWPLGSDCLVSQETAQGVQVASSAITWMNDTLVKADFLNK